MLLRDSITCFCSRYTLFRSIASRVRNTSEPEKQNASANAEMCAEYHLDLVALFERHTTSSTFLTQGLLLGSEPEC